MAAIKIKNMKKTFQIVELKNREVLGPGQWRDDPPEKHYLFTMETWGQEFDTKEEAIHQLKDFLGEGLLFTIITIYKK